MRITALFIASILALGTAGCYTQLALQPPPETIPVLSSSDSTKPAIRVDTIVTRDRETCIWTRNFFGEPILRCYKTTYNRDWYVYRDYPWWYREAPYYYDQYGRCPRYYYYDPEEGSCRYYYDRSYPRYYGNGSFPSTRSTPSSSSSPASSDGRRSRSYGIPQSTPSSGGAILPKSQESPAQTEPATEETRSRRSRSYGIPQSVPSQTEQTAEPLKKENGPSQATQPSPDTAPAPINPTPQDSVTQIEPPRRRNGRGL